jgi:hypothetical protein
MKAGLRHAFFSLALFMGAVLLCRAPVLANEAPWLPVSKVMSELSRNPDFVEALYKESIKFRGVLRLRRLASGCHLRPWPGTIF